MTARWPAGAAAFGFVVAAALIVAAFSTRTRAAAEQPAPAAGEKGKSMVVRVIDVSTGKPVEGAAGKVSAHERAKPYPEFKWGGGNTPPSHTFTTDAQGKAQLPLEKFWLRRIGIVVTKDGYTRRDAHASGEDDGLHLPTVYEAKLEPAGVTIRTIRGLGYLLEKPGHDKVE